MASEYRISVINKGSGVPVDANLMVAALLRRIGNSTVITPEELDEARRYGNGFITVTCKEDHNIIASLGEA